MPDQSHHISYEELEFIPNLSYEKETVWILDHCSKTLHLKELPMVKVLGSKCGIEEATWDLENELRQCFPVLFAPAIA